MSNGYVTISELRACAVRVRDAFANYIDGSGRDAHEVAVALLASLPSLEELDERSRSMTLEYDEPTKKVIADFDAYKRKRFVDLLGPVLGADEPSSRTYESVFSLGYTAGVVDLAQAQRRTLPLEASAPSPPTVLPQEVP